MQNVTKNIITKDEQDKQLMVTHEQFSQLRNSIQALSTKNFGELKQELDQYRADVVSLENIMKEQIQRVQGNILLDMNLERGRIKDEVKELEEHLDTVRQSVDEEITKLTARVDKIQFDLRQTCTRNSLC